MDGGGVDQVTTLVGTWTVAEYRRTAWLRGAVSALNLSGNTRSQYRTASSSAEADMDAIGNDWLVVGEDLRGALRSHYCAQHAKRAAL